MRALLFIVLVAAGIALNMALSPQPARWFVRLACFSAGLAAGLFTLHRLRTAGESSGRAEVENHTGGGAKMVRWCSSALALVFWSKVTGLIVRYLGRDALHYFRLDEKDYATFWPNRLWLLAHISGGMLALLTGPVQFWTGLRNAGMKVHRWTGRAYLLGVLLASASAYRHGPAMDAAEGGLRSGVCMMILATVWLFATGLAVRAVMRKRIASHRAWMTRSFVLAFAFVNIRWLIDAPFLSNLGTIAERVPVIICASWIVPLCLTEIFLQWRRARATAR